VGPVGIFPSDTYFSSQEESKLPRYSECSKEIVPDDPESIQEEIKFPVNLTLLMSISLALLAYTFTTTMDTKGGMLVCLFVPCYLVALLPWRSDYCQGRGMINDDCNKESRGYGNSCVNLRQLLVSCKNGL
jgi:hypothetical protein